LACKKSHLLKGGENKPNYSQKDASRTALAAESRTRGGKQERRKTPREGKKKKRAGAQAHAKKK